MKKVVVLMSTYNGEKYLKEQIESILSQTGVEVSLMVRDDGSKDKTLDILKNYAYHGKLILKEGKNCGVGSSFMNLLYQAPADSDFYSFADQDDIWLPEKLKQATMKLEKNAEWPCLYASNQILVDELGNRKGMRYSREPNYNFQQIISRNYLSGCTMVWNKKLFDILVQVKHRPTDELLQNRIHDVWVAMVATVTGKIVFDMNSYILYRQHKNNVVGAKENTRLDTMLYQLKKLNEPSLCNGRSKLCREIFEKFTSILGNKRDIIYMYAFYRERWDLKKRMLVNDELTKYSGESKIAFRIKVMLNFI